MKQKTKGKILMKIFKRFVEFYKSENEDWFDFFEILINDVAELFNITD